MKLPFANKTITLYNIVEVRDEYNKPNNAYIRTVLHDCAWTKDDKKITVDTISIESDSFKVQIPQSANFVDSWDYTGESGTFTLKADDVVILGEVDDEPAVGSGTSKLLEKYKDRSFAIVGFNNYAGVGYPLPHYEVTGK